MLSCLDFCSCLDPFELSWESPIKVATMMRRNWAQHQSIGHLALNIKEADVEAETCLKPCNAKQDSREIQRP